jgi:hypothetical protein
MAAAVAVEWCRERTIATERQPDSGKSLGQAEKGNVQTEFVGSDVAQAQLVICGVHVISTCSRDVILLEFPFHATTPDPRLC